MSQGGKQSVQRSLLIDAAASLFLILFVLLFAFNFVDFSIKPAEDAAMLMRYAEHFAQGHGIVWNVGEKPIDGSTDFLFVIVLGLLVKAGLSLQFATRSICFASHVLTVLMVYWSLRKVFRSSLVPAITSSLYLAVGPGLYYVATYFGTPFFALFACITWYLALRLTQRRETHRSALLFALSALVTALIRPEGLILSGLVLLAVIYLNGIRHSRLAIAYYLGVFISIGGAYFLWHWHYFGHPLPNPFYRKGGGHIYLDSLRVSLKNVIAFCWPFLLAFVFGLYSPRTLRMTIAFSLPVLGFASAFILLSNEMNFAGRFQYAVMPMVLMSWWPLLSGIRDDLSVFRWSQFNWHKRTALILAVIVLSVGSIVYQGLVAYLDTAGRVTYGRDGRYSVALVLKDYGDKNFTIAATEAGLLPLYSGWRAIDTWGLNDEWIAHNGRITEEYLNRFKPEVIMFHAFSSPLVPFEGSGEWFQMVTTLKTYSEKRGYVLAAAFGISPYDTHYYYVRSDFPESVEIVRRIRTTEYYLSHRKSLNYASLSPSRIE